MTDHSNEADILLVEDNMGDVRLTQEALRESRIKNRLHVVNDGIDALAYLRKEGKYEKASTPDLILLDLNLPRMNGLEVLEVLKSHPTLRRIPVVVLTTSDSEADVLKTYDLHANCYIAKPLDLEQFINVIKSIQGFWFSIVRLPHAEPDQKA